MIAEDNATWIGENNVGCFGSPLGFQRFRNLQQHERWRGTGNEWQGVYDTLYVTYRWPS